MKVTNNITGILLAGGKSSRMGTDKGFINYKNKPFVQHIINAIQPLVSEIIIVSNNPDYDVFGFKRVNDLIENAGPIAGVYTGLHYSKTEDNFVLSCDIPLINTKILRLITENVNDKYQVIQLESDGKTMPLIAMYKKQCKDVFYTLLKDGERRMRIALSHLQVKTITLSNEQEKYSTNINTHKELKEIDS